MLKGVNFGGKVMLFSTNKNKRKMRIETFVFFFKVIDKHIVM